MEREARVKETDSSDASLLVVLEELVKKATDKLLLTDFPACVSLCRHVVSAVKSHEDSEGGGFDERLSHVKEMATVLAIQALAEQGLWRDVIPFVDETYGHIRTCPAKVVQMLVLLHVHVREYLVCHSLVNNWLDCDNHRNDPDSTNIVKIYVNNVLVPLGAFNLIPQVVESCPMLSSEDRNVLLSPTPLSPERNQNGNSLPPVCRASLSVTPSDASPSPRAIEGIERSNKAKDIIPAYMNFVRRLWRSMSRKGWCRKVCRASKVLLLVSFTVLALVHLQSDVVSHWGRAMEVCHTAFEMLNRMLKTGR